MAQAEAQVPEAQAAPAQAQPTAQPPAQEATPSPQAAMPQATPSGGSPAPQAVPESQEAPPASAYAQPKGTIDVDVGDYLHGQGLKLAHVGYDDSSKGIQITASDVKTGRLYDISEKTLKHDMVNAGLMHPDSNIEFKPNTFNTPDTALNEVPRSLDMGDATHFGDTDKMAWSDPAQATNMLLHKLGPERVALADNGTAASIQDSDGVWRKISPDFHNDEGSWDWANTVYNISQHQKAFAAMAAFGAGSAVVEPLAEAGAATLGGSMGGETAVGLSRFALNQAPKAIASVAGGLAEDATNMVMGRVVGTTGENPDETLRSVVMHAALNAVVPGIMDGIVAPGVMKAMKFGLNALGTMPEAAISTTARLLSMFGDGNATNIEHAMTHAPEVSAAADNIVDSAVADRAVSLANGRARNMAEATQQAAAAAVAKAGQAFTGDVQSMGKLQANLGRWMDGKTSELVSSLGDDTKEAIQQNLPVNAITAANSIRQGLGQVGITVNAAGRVTANDLAASFGSMTPLEQATAAKSTNFALATLEKLSHFDASDPDAWKDLANMDEALKGLQETLQGATKVGGDSSMLPKALQEAGKHLDNVRTLIDNGLPPEFRPTYDSLVKEYANKGAAVNYVMNGIGAGGQSTMTGAGTRVAQLFNGKGEMAEMFKSLQDITPNSQALTTELQTQMSAGYLLNYSAAPTSTFGGLKARLGAFVGVPIVKGAIRGVGSAQNAAQTFMETDSGAQMRAAANAATQAASNTPGFKEVRSALADLKSPSDIMDKTKLSRVITAYGVYKMQKQNQ